MFDNQILAQAVSFGFSIGEISCPTRYQPESSSIGFWRSTVYGIGVVRTALRFRLHRLGLVRDRLFDRGGRRLEIREPAPTPATLAAAEPRLDDAILGERPASR